MHGFVRDSFHPERHVQHAWCEFPAQAKWSDGSVTEITVAIDYSQLDPDARIAPCAQIYPLMDVRELKRYTREEALAEAVRAGNDGPWESSPGGVNDPTTSRTTQLQP